MSERIAYSFYQTTLEANGLKKPIDRPKSIRLPEHVVRQGLSSFLQPHPDKKFTSNSIGQAIQLGQKHIRDAGRKFTQELTLADDRMDGWARTSEGGKVCAFCTMLIGRGPVYKSAQSAGESAEWHPGCNCHPVHVVEGEWPGREQYEQSDSLWRANSTDGMKDTGGQQKFKQLNTFRRNLGGHANLPAPPKGIEALRAG